MYQYDRIASVQSLLARKVGEMAKSLENDLSAAVVRYTGNKFSGGTAKVDVKGERLRVTLWLDMGEETDPNVMEELTKILIGGDASIGPHALAPNVWVAVKTIQI